ncbi:putative cytochrome c [Cardiosporidium cionae]|uniref:Cytochrome c n=1 Tax=Cardiosporidium cionae TaxID=476202 RepID=A0ABQ7JAJ7_9APIC|nr:putative cytochrome c [Cardiosporidium cionae]|eukprot:KAF8821021.1 putative cytochrome c [Cardiosporidium cionae]
MTYPDFKPYDDDDVPDDFVLPPGEVARGKQIFKKRCAQCHSIRKDCSVTTGRSVLGPSLYGVYGRAAGMNERNSILHSSDGMTTAGILWTDLNLMRYIKNPRAFTDSPIYMNFRGIDDWQERVDLIWYLKKISEDDINTPDINELNAEKKIGMIERIRTACSQAFGKT